MKIKWGIIGVILLVIVGCGIFGLYLDQTDGYLSNVVFLIYIVATAGTFFTWGGDVGKERGRGEAWERARQALSRGALKFGEKLDSDEELAEEFSELLEELDYPG